FLDVCLSDKFGGRRKYPQFPHYGFDLSHAWSLLPPMIQDVETGRCQRNARILHCVKSATAFIHMAKIHQQDLITSVADALQYISYFHPQDYITALAEAYEAEQSPAAKDAIAQILTNSRLCAEGRRPICQDTGIVCAFVKIGMGVQWEGATMSVADWVVKTVPTMGAGWCPPGMLGIGIGGSAEKAMLLAKEALMETIDLHELRARGPANRLEELRLEIYDKVNALGIGAQGLGGLSTVLDVKILDYPTHAASLPVAIIPNCAATRHAHFTLDGGGATQLDPPDLSQWPEVRWTPHAQSR